MTQMSVLEINPGGPKFEIVDAAARAAATGPLVANTAAGMTDTSKIYVYTGDETGYENGHWYYYDGSAWQDGGVYNAVAVQTDTTLTLSGVPADAKVTGDRVTAVEDKLNSIADFNLFDSSTVTTGKIISANGSIANGSTGGYCDYIPVSAGDYVIKFKLTNPTMFGNNRIHGYNSSKQWVEQIVMFQAPPANYDVTYKLTVPSGIDYIRISFPQYLNQSDTVVAIYNGGEGISAIDNGAREGIDHLKSQADAAINSVDGNRIITNHYSRTSGLTSGVISTNGSTFSASGAAYTQPFEVVEGETLSVQRYYLNNGAPSGLTSGTFGTVIFFADNTFTYTGWGQDWAYNQSSIFVPFGAKYAQVTIATIASGTYTDVLINRSLPVTEYYHTQETFKSPCRYNGALTANVFQPIGKVCVDDYIVTLSMPVDENFSSVILSGQNAAGTGTSIPSVEVTPTQVILHSNVDSSYDVTENHGLTIANDLQIILLQSKEKLTAKIIVTSSGNTWEKDDFRLGSSYRGFGVISESNVSSVDASIAIRDLYKPVWVCGDSWVMIYKERWYGQAIALGINGFLHSGHAGEGSGSGLAQLQPLLDMFTPKMIVWLYGMNDADTNDSTPNASWLAAYNALKAICTNRSIELVLATIPTTPSINNNAKNAVVLASGYRYVDEVAAMGADTSGNWISGYQSSDGNHTTVAGAKALLARVLADVPEIALNQ